VATTRFLTKHIGKGKTIAVSITECLEYGNNPVKTADGKYVSSFACDPRTADAEFLLTKQQYTAITGREQHRDHDVLIYQIRQAFKPEEISPEDANRIGYEMAMRWTKGRHAFMVTTHIDKAHIHNHIYYNSVKLDCTGKFRDFLGSAKAMRRLNDCICLENGLSIIKNPKRKGKHYAAWLGSERPLSFRQKLRQAIDTALAGQPADFDAFLSLMKLSDYEYKQGKNLKFRAPGQEKFTQCRQSTLGEEYTGEAIRERIEGKRILSFSGSGTTINGQVKFTLLIDLQNSVKVKNSPGYERWAKVFNLKQLAQTFNFLEENNLTDYRLLEEKTAEAVARFNDLSGKIKQTENRMSEVAALQKHISAYSRTRDTYIAYRKAGYSKKFYAEHESEILLHKAAKQAFDAQNLKKLPTVKVLKQEYASLLAGKKKLYQSYREAREEMKKYTTAKANADQLLNYSDPQQVRENRKPNR